MSTLYDTIAENTGFQVPELFRRMTEDGVTDYTKNRDQSSVKPPALPLPIIETFTTGSETESSFARRACPVS